MKLICTENLKKKIEKTTQNHSKMKKILENGWKIDKDQIVNKGAIRQRWLQ